MFITLERLLFTIAASCAVLGSLAAPSSAYYDDYLPSNLRPSIKQIKQTLVKYDFNNEWQCGIKPGIKAEIKEGDFTIEGVDKSGRPWKIKEEENHSCGGSCFLADVDNNGVEDVIFWFATGSNGYPFSVVSIYFFDKNNVPHHEEIISRFSVNKDGVPDIITAPDGKGSFVLVQDLAQANCAGKDRSYWRFTMMRAHDCTVSFVKSAFGQQFPAYVYFTSKPNHLLSKHSIALEKEYQHQIAEGMKQDAAEAAKQNAEEGTSSDEGKSN